MNGLEKYILELLSASVQDTSLKPDTDYLWEDIYKELSVQTVAMILADHIGEMKLSPEQKKNYIIAVAQNITYWNRLLYVQQTLVDELKKEQIPAAVLKGTAAAIYYPKPEYRNMGDIDLIVHPDFFQRAVQVMERLGCVNLHHKNERHENFVKDGIHIELHHYFSMLPDSTEARYLDHRIYAGLAAVEYKTIGENTFPMLPPVDNGLVLLQHISQHLESGLGLRQIMDWMFFVKSELKDDLWMNEFKDAAKKIGLKKLAEITTRMCQMYLGLDSSVTWCSNADKEACEHLMNYIMSHGNFGRKDIVSSSTVYIMYNLKHPALFFRLAQKNGSINWKILERCAWLKPFAWIYQLCRWARKGVKRDHVLSGLFHDAMIASAEDRFLDELGVRRTKIKKGNY